MTPEHDILSTDGFAAVVEPADDQPDDALTVHGVLVGEGDVSHGLSGVPTRWPPEVLRDLEGELEGTPITLPDSDDPEQHVGVERTDDGQLKVAPGVPLEHKAGEITATKYVENVGLAYEATLNHPKAEEFVERGVAHVSPVMARDVEPDPEADDPDQMVATAVHAVRDVGMVARGGMPSNSIATGPMSALSAEALAGLFPADAEAAAEDADAADGEGGDETPEEADADEEAPEDDEEATPALPTDAGGLRGAMARRVARTRAPDRKTIKDGAHSVAADSGLARAVLGNQRGDTVDEDDAVARQALGLDDEDDGPDRTPVDVEDDPVARAILGLGGDGDDADEAEAEPDDE